MGLHLFYSFFRLNETTLFSHWWDMTFIIKTVLWIIYKSNKIILMPIFVIKWQVLLMALLKGDSLVMMPMMVIWWTLWLWDIALLNAAVTLSLYLMKHSRLYPLVSWKLKGILSSSSKTWEMCPLWLITSDH